MPHSTTKYLTEWKKKHESLWKFVVIVEKYDSQIFKFQTYKEAEDCADSLVYSGVGLNNINIMTMESFIELAN